MQWEEDAMQLHAVTLTTLLQLATECAKFSYADISWLGQRAAKHQELDIAVKIWWQSFEDCGESSSTGYDDVMHCIKAALQGNPMDSHQAIH